MGTVAGLIRRPLPDTSPDAAAAATTTAAGGGSHLHRGAGTVTPGPEGLDPHGQQRCPGAAARRGGALRHQGLFPLPLPIRTPAGSRKTGSHPGTERKIEKG